MYAVLLYLFPEFSILNNPVNMSNDADMIIYNKELNN